MYIFKPDLSLEINKTQASKTIGITREYLTQILNRKQKCSKLTAYCITKFLNSEGEIDDYFIRED